MMVLVLIVGVLPPLSISAREKVIETIDITELSVSQDGSPAKGIAYSEAKGRFELINIGDAEETQEVAMKWEIGNKDVIHMGTYTISYYVVNPTTGETNRIELDFHVGSQMGQDGTTTPDPEKIGIKIRMYDGNGTDAVETNYQKYKRPYVVGERVMKGTFYTDNISIKEGISPTEKELKVRVSDYNPIKLYYADQTIYLSIDNVKQGYITPVQLVYQALDVNTAPKKGGFVTFKGLDAFNIAPTHLLTQEEAAGLPIEDKAKNMMLPSQQVIRMEQITEGNDKIPGSRPGVVVSFNKPQVVGKDGEFVSINDEKAYQSNKPTKAKLLLMKRYASTITEDLENRTYAVTFGFNKGNTGIYRDEVGATKDGEIISNDTTGKFEIYFAADKYGNDAVHIWEGIKAGMILDAHIDFDGHYFDGHYFENENHPGYIVTSNTVKTKRSGNTYMWYNISRSGKDTVTLQVKPYDIASGKITYNLYRESQVPTENKKLKPIEIRHYEAEDMGDQIHITTDMIDGIRYYFLNIQINGGSNDFSTQIISYNPYNAPTPAPYPEIKSIDNVYVIANENPSEKNIPETIGMDITWHVPKELRAYLQGGHAIYYELYMNNKEKGDYTPIKVFKVYEDPNPKPGQKQPDILVEVHAGTVEANGEEQKVARYDAAKGTITVENILLKLPGYTKWEKLDIKPINDGYLENGSYPEIVENASDNGIYVNHDGLGYTIPGSYYFKMRSVYAKKDASKLAASGASDPVVLSLDVTQEILPTVTNDFLAQDASGNGNYKGVISFAPVNLERYIKYMLAPSQMFLSDPNASDYEDKKYLRTYEIYLSKSQKDKTQTQDIGVVTLGNAREGDLSTLQAVFKAGAPEESSQLASEALRQGKTLKFEILGYTNEGKLEVLQLEGLDPNTPYYVQARVKAARWKDTNKDGTYEQVAPVYSIYSKYASFTTGTRPLPPTPDEKYPPAPDLFERLGDKTDPIKNTVKLTWKEPEFANTAEGAIYYEIIRSESQVIKDEHNKRSVSIDSIIQSQQDLIGNKYRVFSTAEKGAEDGYLEYYDYSKKAWENVTPLTDIENHIIEDNTLQPNTIYYYYIRTIHNVKGEELRSEWIMVPITSSSLDRPVGLKVESPQAYKHDPTKEVVISFLAPIPKDKRVGRGKDYDFEVAIKGEKDDQYYIANATDDDRTYATNDVKEITIDDTVYRKFVYTLSGLQHGTRYDIKVRIVDRTQGVGKEVKSLYSDKVIARTEFDQEEDDKENAYDKYLEKYEQEAEKLKKEPAWKVESKKDAAVYKYRNAYIGEEIGRNKNYTLQVEEDATHVYYYLPLDTFERARKSQTMIEVELQDYKIHLRAGILKDHEDIEDALQYIEDKKAKDAYIALEIYEVSNNNRIQGSKPLTKEMTIGMDIVFVDEEDRIIEDMIMESLLKLIEDGQENVIKKLEKEVKNGKIEDERLDAIIQDEIDAIKDKHEEKVRRILEKEEDKVISIESIQKPMLLVGKVDAFAVNGYYYNGSIWEGVTAFQTANGFAMDSNKLGSYILTGVEGGGNILVPTIPGANDLITKYHLTDFFTVDKNGLNGYVTKEQLYGSVARMIGAQRGTDYVIALQNRGIKLIMPQNVYQTVRYDEAIYVMMQAYEKMYYKPIGSIHITNKQSVQNIAAFQPPYRPYVYAAVELGVVKTENNRLNPSKPITVEELLRMLTKIMPR